MPYSVSVLLFLYSSLNDGKRWQGPEGNKKKHFSNVLSIGAFKTAPLESAQGKFDLLDWENYQLGELELHIQCPILPIGKHVLGQEGVSKRIHRPSNCSPSSRQHVSRETQNGTEHQEAFTGVKVTNYHSTPYSRLMFFFSPLPSRRSALRPCKCWLCFACAKALLEHIKCPCSRHKNAACVRAPSSSTECGLYKLLVYIQLFF